MKKMYGSLLRAAVLLSLSLLLASLLLTGCEVATTETKTFSVKYLDASGAVLKTEEVQRGGTATPPEVSHAADKKVVWLTESGNRFDFSFAIDRDWTLRASLVTREYTLSVSGTNATVSVTDEDGHRLTDTVKHGDVVTVTAIPNENAEGLTVSVNGTAETVTDERFTKTYTIEGDMTVSASASVIRYPITVTTDEHVTLSFLGDDGNALADPASIEALAALRITAAVSEGYVLRAISVTMGDTPVTAADGVFTIGRVTGAVAVTAETDRERTVSGTVKVWDPTFDPAKFSITQNGYALDATCGADGAYTIRGLVCEDAELILNYAGYYSLGVILTADDGYTIEGCDATFQYRMIENYTNGVGYNYGTIGNTTKDFTLGWAHNARFKDLRLAVSDTSDFALMTTLTKLDKNGVVAGVSLDIYGTDGSLSRNVIFTYDLTEQSLKIATFTRQGAAYDVTMTVPMGLSLVCPTGAADTAMHVALLRHGGQYYFAIGQNADGTLDRIIELELTGFSFAEDEGYIGFGAVCKTEQYASFTNSTIRLGEAAADFAATFGIGCDHAVTVEGDANAQVTIKDAASTTYGNGDMVAGGKRLTVTASAADGFAVKSFTVTMGGVSLTVTGNTCVIPSVSGAVNVTVVTERERTVSGTVTVTGETLDPSKLSVNVGTITCNADGSFTIYGIGSDVTELTLSYANYYDETLSIGSDVTVTGKTVAFRYRVMENYQNGLNYNSKPLGDTTKQFTLGWAHSARLKGLYLSVTDTRDFALTATIVKMDDSNIYAGPSLDLYTADGTITRNIIFGYRVGDQKLVIMTMTKKGTAYEINTTEDTGLTLSRPDGTEAKYVVMALMRIDGAYYVAVGQNGDGTYAKTFAIDASLLNLQSDETQMGFGVSESGQQYTMAKDAIFRLGTEATAYAGTTLGLGQTFDVTVSASTGATVTIKDAQGTTYADGGKVAGGKHLTVTVSVADGAAVKSFTVKVGDETVAVTGNTYTIGLVKGNVVITVATETERTVSGNLSISGGEALDPTKFTTNVGSVECSADGSFTIRGIGSDVTELTLSYANYYDEKLSIGTDATVTGKTVAFRYRVMENYKNALGYNSNPLGDTTKQFTLGWAHSARMKGLYLPITDTRDFVVQTVIRQFGNDPSKDGSYISAGVSLDLYKADGTLSRNLTFRYKQTTQTLIVETFGGETYQKEITTELTLPKPIGTDATAWNVALIRASGSYYFAIGTVADGTYSVIPVDLSDFTLDATETQVGFGVTESNDQHAYFTDCAFLVGTEATAFASGKIPAKDDEA